MLIDPPPTPEEHQRLLDNGWVQFGGVGCYRYNETYIAGQLPPVKPVENCKVSLSVLMMDCEGDHLGFTLTLQPRQSFWQRFKNLFKGRNND